MFSLRTRSFPLKSTKRASSFKLLIFVLHYWSFWPVRFYLTRLDLYNKNVGMTVGATSSSGQNTKSAGFRNRLLPRRTRLQSFQLCVTLTASGETITSEHHFTHKLFNKRKKSSHTRLKTTTKKKITSWHLEFPLTLSTNLSAAWRTGLSPSGAPWRRSVGSQRKSNSVFKKAKLRKTWETVAGLCRCSLSSHPAKRAHWRCANASNTCLLYASSHPPTPTPPLRSPIATIHGCCHGDRR